MKIMPLNQTLTRLAYVCAAFMAGIMHAADVEFFIIAKEQFYRLDSQGVQNSEPHENLFFAAVVQSDAGTVSDARLTRPDQSQEQLNSEAYEWYLDIDYLDRAALDAAWPDGTYTLHITGVNDGAKSISLNLTGDYVAPLQITNFAALQAADANQPITIQWTPPPGATADDFILVYVETCEEDEEFMSPLPWEEGGLTGLDTNFTIPVGVLPPGMVFRVEIEYFRVVQQHAPDNTAYPGVYGVAAFGTGLNFDIHTAGVSDGLCGAQFNVMVGVIGLPVLQLQGDTATAQLSYPVPRQYAVALNVRDPNPAPYQQVYFTGPAGSGINNVQAVFGNTHDYGTHYSSPNYAMPPYPLSGTYSVQYRGNPFARQMDFSFVPAVEIVAVPTFHVSNGNVVSVDIAYRDPDSGAVVDVSGMFDYANISISNQSGGWYWREFMPGSGSIPLADLNIRWDQLTGSVNINFGGERFTVYSSYSVALYGGTWAGYVVDHKGWADTGGMLGHVYTGAKPWIYSNGVNNWLYIEESFVLQGTCWAWVANLSGMPGSGTISPGTWFGWYFDNGGPWLESGNWVHTGQFLQHLYAYPQHVFIWSRNLPSWLRIVPTSMSAHGGWVYVFGHP